MARDNQALRTLLILASLMIITAGLKAAGDLMIPLLVSLFFAVLCIPSLTRLQSLGVPNGFAIAIVVLGATAVLLGVAAVIGTSLVGFESKMDGYLAGLDAQFGSLFGWLRDQGIDFSAEELTAEVNSKAVFQFVAELVSRLLGTLSDILLVLLTMIFMLVEAASIPEKLRHAMGNPDADLREWRSAMEQVRKYVAIKAAISLATGLLAVGLALVVGVDFPLLWGLIAFLFNFIPNVGSAIAAVPPTLLALVQFGMPSALVVAGGYIVINMVMGNVVEPRLMGERLGLSPLVVFLSLIFWYWVWGPVGMVLSVPLTVIVKILMEHDAQFRGVAIMLGGANSTVPPISNSTKSNQGS